MANRLLASAAILVTGLYLGGLLVLRTAVNGQSVILDGLPALGAIAWIWIACSRVRLRASWMSNAQRGKRHRNTSGLALRNSQLSALYRVFAEITDPLNLQHVIWTTLREARRVMGADMVVLRVLRGEMLEVSGAIRPDGSAITGLPPVRLGEGPTGRAAKRGRTIRLDSGAQQVMNTAPVAVGQPPQPSRSWMESGIIAPLIAGTRVVGTLSCWAERPHAFNEEDEAILQIMSSMVGTAILAAETTETSEAEAMRDPLTELPNRRQLDHDAVAFGSQADGRSLAVAMADVDYFKGVNDAHGHRVGDTALRRIAGILRQSIRHGDRLYRYGGDEFVIIFEGVTREEAILMAQRVVDAVGQTPLHGAGMERVGPMTLSVGLAFLADHPGDIEGLIDFADQALYLAKRAGRNRLVAWSSEAEPAEIGSVA